MLLRRYMNWQTRIFYQTYLEVRAMDGGDVFEACAPFCLDPSRRPLCSPKPRPRSFVRALHLAGP